MCSVLLNVVKFSTDGESLSISKGTGEVYKATSMIPKKRRPSIDEFGLRSALGIPKSLSGLTIVDTVKRQAEVNLAYYGSGSIRHCMSVQCVEGRKDATRSDDGPISIYSQKRKNPDFDPLENVFNGIGNIGTGTGSFGTPSASLNSP